MANFPIQQSTVALLSVWPSWAGRAFMSPKQLRIPSCKFGLRKLNSSLTDWALYGMDQNMTELSSCFTFESWRINQFTFLTAPFFECTFSVHSKCEKRSVKRRVIYWLCSKSSIPITRWRDLVKKNLISGRFIATLVSVLWWWRNHPRRDVHALHVIYDGTKECC